MTDLPKTVQPTDADSQPPDDSPTWPAADAATQQPVGVMPRPAGSSGPAPDVTVHRGALGATTASDINVSIGAIGAARAERVSVELGSIGAVAAREVRVRTGGVGAIAGQTVQLELALVRSIVAQHVTLGRGSGAGIVIAARVDGDGTPLLDWRGGLAVGTILAVVWLLARRLR
jgi:hypothetical protein